MASVSSELFLLNASVTCISSLETLKLPMNEQHFTHFKPFRLCFCLMTYLCTYMCSLLLTNGTMVVLIELLYFKLYPKFLYNESEKFSIDYQKLKTK